MSRQPGGLSIQVDTDDRGVQFVGSSPVQLVDRSSSGATPIAVLGVHASAIRTTTIRTSATISQCIMLMTPDNVGASEKLCADRL
jgi:hypothetical protein